MLSNYEKETTISFNEEEKIAQVYTCKKSLQNKLDAFCISFPEDYWIINSDLDSKTYQINKKLISFRSPTKKKILSEEEKQILRDRLSKNRK